MPVTASQKTNRWRRLAFVVFGAFIVGYLLLCLVTFFVQRRMIYFPAKMELPAAENYAASRGFVAWKNPSGEIIGWRLPAQTNSTGSVLILHGNGGLALNRNYLATPIHQAASVDVFILEYPGYGARPGGPSEKSFLAAAEEAFQLLPTNAPKFIVTESLGTGVGAHLAQKFPTQVAAMILFVPYDNFVSLAQSKMPFLPVALILRDRFQPAKWLENYRGPIHFVLAAHDEIIPIRFGKKLYESYQGPKSVQVFASAGHNDVGAQSPEWWRKVFDFWLISAGE